MIDTQQARCSRRPQKWRQTIIINSAAWMDHHTSRRRKEHSQTFLFPSPVPSKFSCQPQKSVDVLASLVVVACPPLLLATTCYYSTPTNSKEPCPPSTEISPRPPRVRRLICQTSGCAAILSPLGPKFFFRRPESLKVLCG